MSNPHPLGSTDPLHRPRSGYPPPSPSPLQPEFLAPGPGFPPEQHQYGYSGSPNSLPPGSGQGVPHHISASQQQVHGYTPSNLVQVEARRPHLSIAVPHEQVPPPPTFSLDYVPHQPAQHGGQTHPPSQAPLQPSFYGSGLVQESNGGPSSLNQDGTPFSPFPHTPAEGNSIYLNMRQQEWPPGAPPAASKGASSAQRSTSSPATKVPRHQFTACGACRHRRVKCDLRARQEEAERDVQVQDAQGSRAASTRRKKVSCTNCRERGTNCVDEYAPLKAAKQLRRGKRISEIEMLYGKSATDAALANQGEDSDRAFNPVGRRIERLPELTREFFDSAFFRRFNIQRPVIDTVEFVTRYLSKPIPCAAAMGPEGAVLCHCLYAWAISYGVDERGQLDVAEGGGEPLGPISLVGVGEAETRRERDRQRRLEKLQRVVRTILHEIDDCGILRKPTWDGVRSLFLILPLTEGITSPVERQAIYQASLSQVFILCSTDGRGYDGTPAVPTTIAGKDDDDRQRFVRMRIYWYAFVHEGVTNGLKGGALYLDDEEEVSSLQELVDNQSPAQSPAVFHTTFQMVTAPIRLAWACRQVHDALTGPRARRRDTVSVEKLHSAWEKLEQSWEEFDSIKYENTAEPFRVRDELVRFADGWKIYLFEAYSYIRKSLEERLERLEATAALSAGRLTEVKSRSPSASPMLPADAQTEMGRLRHLLEIARSKCQHKSRQIVEIVRTHVGSRFFEWDASMVRDGTYEAAMVLARDGGSDEDISICLQALNEGRWAFAKGQERSEVLRKTWLESRSRSLPSPHDTPMGSGGDGQTASGSPPFTSPSFGHHGHPLPTPQSQASTWPPSASIASSARFSPRQQSPVQNSHYMFQTSPPLPQHMTQQQEQHQPHHHGQLQNLTPPLLFDGLQPGGVHSGMSSPITPTLQVHPPGQYVLQPDGSQVFVPYGLP